MRIYQAENYKAMSRRAANIISAQVIYKPNCVLGLATGGTPDMRNNVIYNWSGNGCYGGAAMGINIVDNYYKPGPATDAKVANRVMARKSRGW